MTKKNSTLISEAGGGAMLGENVISKKLFFELTFIGARSMLSSKNSHIRICGYPSNCRLRRYAFR